jgi:hypothetical protein
MRAAPHLEYFPEHEALRIDLRQTEVEPPMDFCIERRAQECTRHSPTRPIERSHEYVHSHSVGQSVWGALAQTVYADHRN